jgi:hypothetical protein
MMLMMIDREEKVIQQVVIAHILSTPFFTGQFALIKQIASSGISLKSAAI